MREKLKKDDDFQSYFWEFYNQFQAPLTTTEIKFNLNKTDFRVKMFKNLKV